jgi:hypothetical protein
MEGVRGVEGAPLQAALGQGPPEIRDRVLGPGNHAEVRRVHRGQIEMVAEQALDLVLRQGDAQHGAGRQASHGPAARRH